jgi:hypothetical protein
MKNELRTMEEKNSLDPNELMENGLTRAQNEKLVKSEDNVSFIFGLISIGLGVWILSQVL